jgi:hypothetical protein
MPFELELAAGTVLVGIFVFKEPADFWSVLSPP